MVTVVSERGRKLLSLIEFFLVFAFKGKFRREFRNALEKCRCGRVRVEDRSLYHSTPATRINNISPSSRSNYQLTSLRDMNSIRDRQVNEKPHFELTFFYCISFGTSGQTWPDLIL